MKVSDLFYLYQGNGFDLSSMTIDNNSNINFVARTENNNGIVAKVKAVPIKPFPAGAITVALNGSVLSSFVQVRDFYTAFHIMILIPKNKMRLEEKLYYCMCIKFNAYRYLYGRQANKTLKDIEIPQIPDWLKNYKIDYSKITTKIKEIKLNLDFKNWKEFKLKDIFLCEVAKSEDFGKLQKGDIPFIGRTPINNGLQGYVKVSKVNKGNCITVSMVGSVVSTWQRNNFIASQNILLLYSKYLNMFNSLFIVSILNFILRLKCINYDRPIQKNKFVNEYIKLPKDSNGNPDWKYMEEYIKSLPNSDLIQ